MSATAFQRLRREQMKDQIRKEPSQAELLSGLTVKQLKAMLEENGIEYDKKANKPELIKLLISTNDEPPKEDGSDNSNVNAEDDEKKEKEAEDDLEKKPEGAE